jgi:HEAT repeat protein
VRRRAAEISAAYPAVDLLASLDDPDDRVVEVAAWACGEHESRRDEIVERLIDLAGTADDPLVRESAVAALGAIGDERGLEAIIAACGDKPAVRRRAVLALAPFEGSAVDATIERALTDRDWQVRQAAEDLRRAQS